MPKMSKYTAKKIRSLNGSYLYSDRSAYSALTGPIAAREVIALQRDGYIRTDKVMRVSLTALAWQKINEALA